MTAFPFQRNAYFFAQAASYLSWVSVLLTVLKGTRENKEIFRNLQEKKSETIQDMHFIVINNFI